MSYFFCITFHIMIGKKIYIYVNRIKIEMRLQKGFLLWCEKRVKIEDSLGIQKNDEFLHPMSKCAPLECPFNYQLKLS